MSQRKQENRPPEFESFGEALRYYREHIADRLRLRSGGPSPNVQLSAKDVVAEMKRADYQISQAAYSDIEQGQYLPKDPDRFMEAVTRSLALEVGSAEYLNLMDHLLFDVIEQRLGKAAAALYRDEIRSIRRSSVVSANAD